MRCKQLILCGLSGLLLSGCFTTGKNFPSDLKWIKKDQTTKVDVKMMLGAPYSVGNSGGIQTWTYGYYEYKIMGKANHKELKFYWNPEDMVKHYNFNSSFPADTAGSGGMLPRTRKPATTETPGDRSSIGSNTAVKKWGSY